MGKIPAEAAAVQQTLAEANGKGCATGVAAFLKMKKPEFKLRLFSLTLSVQSPSRNILQKSP